MVHATSYLYLMFTCILQMAKVSSSRTTESASSYTPSTTSSMTPKSSVDPSSGVKQSNNNSAANVQQVNPTSPDKIQQPVALSSSMRDMTPTKVVGSNGIKYEVSPMLEKKQHLHEKGPTSESGSVGGNTHISTFSPTPVPKPSSTFSSLRDTSDITQRVNNLITDYENSLKATATTTITESPRVSKNRYASATSLSNEFESTHTSNKPYIEPTKAADTNESFASQYSQRVKDTMEVGGYQKQNFTMAPPPQPAKQTYQQSTIDKLNLSRDSVILRKADAHAEDEFADLRQAVKPVTSVELEEALELLKYDIHREVQDVIREQVRQFAMAKVGDLSI